MSTQAQNDYIHDLAVKKTKEFKEVKELIVAKGIIKNNDTVMQAATLAEIVNALTDLQASKLIEALIEKPEPKRDTRYADARMKKAIELLDEVREDIADWDFNGLR